MVALLPCHRVAPSHVLCAAPSHRRACLLRSRSKSTRSRTSCSRREGRTPNVRSHCFAAPPTATQHKRRLWLQHAVLAPIAARDSSWWPRADLWLPAHGPCIPSASNSHRSCYLGCCPAAAAARHAAADDDGAISISPLLLLTGCANVPCLQPSRSRSRRTSSSSRSAAASTCTRSVSRTSRRPTS